MVQTIRIEASARERAGKGAARATRREGKVPAVIYGAKKEATLIALDPRDVMKELQKGGWQSSLYEVAVNGSADRSIPTCEGICGNGPDHSDRGRGARAGR